MQVCKTNTFFGTGAQVSWISYDCYRELTLKTKINTKVKAKISSSDGSTLGPIGIDLCSVTLSTDELKHKFIVCRHLLVQLS